jgi:hypothetical protein
MHVNEISDVGANDSGPQLRSTPLRPTWHGFLQNWVQFYWNVTHGDFLSHRGTHFSYKKLWNITIFHGKIHYFYGPSIPWLCKRLPGRVTIQLFWTFHPTLSGRAHSVHICRAYWEWRLPSTALEQTDPAARLSFYFGLPWRKKTVVITYWSQH